MASDPRVVRVFEHGWIRKADIGELSWTRLQAADRRLAREHGACVFDWCRPTAAKAKSYVGVLAVEGLTVEILPKVDEAGLEERSAQRNLLLMLQRAGALPFREGGLAELAEEHGSLLDVFARLFARTLLREWRRGPDRGYLHREENLQFLRGRIIIPENVRRNGIHKERFFVAHDVLEEDTALNRLLKAAVRRLLATCRGRETRHHLGVLLEEMSFVMDVGASEARMMRVPLGRLNERYRTLRDLAHQILGGRSPSMRAMGDTSFSILFRMEQVFEQYVAETIRSWAPRLGVARSRVRIQARGDRRFLLRSLHTGRSRAMLIPDVWLEPLEGNRGIVLDTKWKLPAERGEGMGVESADAYQMLAYGQTYDAETLLLVYPRYRDYSEMEWDFPDGRHRLKVVEWPVGGNLEATERAMFIEAGSWLSLPVEANRVREIAADLDPGAIPPR